MSLLSPMALVKAEQDLQLQLCCVLEHLADGLPGVGDRKLADMATVGLVQGVTRHREIGDNLLFPLIRKRTPPEADLLPVLAMLEHEHVTDEGLSFETADELRTLAETGRCANPAMLGYMLRGTFEALRRHVGWERALIIPYAETVLQDEDLESIEAWFQDDGRAGDLVRMQKALRIVTE